jgi:hypothetical protein
MTKVILKNVGANLRVCPMIAALAIGLVMISCGGGNSKQQQGGNSATETKTEQPAAGGVSTIPKDKISPLGFGTTEEKEAVIAEIPQELFKSIGKLSYCQIMKNSYSDEYKYVLTIRTSNQDGVADLKKLVDYYRSIGATVVEKAANSNYDVKFDYAQSESVESAGSYIQVQFSVVKK